MRGIVRAGGGNYQTLMRGEDVAGRDAETK